MTFSHDRSDPFEPPDDDLRALFQRTAPEVSATDLETLYATARSSHSPSKPVLSRRLVMTIRITFGTLAAAGAVALVSLLVPRETAAFDFDEVQRQVAATRSVTFTRTMVFDGKPQPATRTLVSAQDRLRFEHEGGYTVYDFKARKRMQVDARFRTAEVQNLSTDTPRGSDLYALFREVARDSYATLPARQIDGKRALGFVANWHGHEVAIWVDPETRLPIRIEQTRKELGHNVETVDQNIVFDRPLDDALFRLDPPKGFHVGSMPFKVTFLEPALLPLPRDPALAAPELQPRSGIGPARFGMTKEQIIARLGQPDSEFTQGRTTYLAYRSRGFELAIQPADRPRPGLSQVLCFDRQDAPPGSRRRFQGKTDRGIGLGSRRAEILEAYGPPDRASETPSGQTTLDYQASGLSFRLSGDQVSQITLVVPPSGGPGKP